MIVKDEDAIKRLASPMNLINKLRAANGNGNKKNNAMSLFGIGKKPLETSLEIREQVKISFNPFGSSESSKSSEAKEQLSSLVPSSIPQQVPSSEPILDNILKDNESQIKLGLAHDRALDLLNRAVDQLATKLDDVKADKLPSVISAASKTVESIRRERSEASKNNKDREVHFHFYTPEQKKISEYEVIDVT